MFFLVTCIALGACTQRMICPAYQSAFIYDKATLQKRFSYFNEDSTPKIYTASKNKFLVAEAVSYHKKVRSLQTVEMQPVFPIVPDSLRDDYVSQEDLDSAANSIIDSTYIVDVEQADTLESVEDSVYVITKDKEVRLLKYDADSLKYTVVDVRLNVDQDHYMWYLRDVLILPDVRIAKMQGEAQNKSTSAKEKKGFFGLFKKKKKDKLDTVNFKAVKAEDDFDYIDTLEQAKPVVEPAKPKKKGFWKDKAQKSATENDEATTLEEKPAKKKKSKKKKAETEVKEEEIEEVVPEEEKQDDGF